MQSYTFKLILLFSLLVSCALPCSGASFWERLGLGGRKGTNQTATATATLAALSQTDVVNGLKAALDQGIQNAVDSLGKKGGYLNDLQVRIPVPENLAKLEQGLRLAKQDKLADEFVAAMNTAAEQAVPRAAPILADALRRMTFEDAQSILTGTNTAATQYFQGATATNLYAQFLPIVQTATAKAGVTRAYKTMTASATLGGNVGRMLFGGETPNLDGYITRKAIDGLFYRIGEEEKRIRAEPAARTTQLLRRVFGAQ